MYSFSYLASMFSDHIFKKLIKGSKIRRAAEDRVDHGLNFFIAEATKNSDPGGTVRLTIKVYFELFFPFLRVEAETEA